MQKSTSERFEWGMVKALIAMAAVMFLFAGTAKAQHMTIGSLQRACSTSADETSRIYCYAYIRGAVDAMELENAMQNGQSVVSEQICAGGKTALQLASDFLAFVHVEKPDMDTQASVGVAVSALRYSGCRN